MDACEIITKTRELFADGTKWRRGSLGYKGESMCLVGGLRCVAFGDPNVDPYYQDPDKREPYRKAMNALKGTIDATAPRYYSSVVSFNDNQETVGPVLAVLDKTKKKVC